MTWDAGDRHPSTMTVTGPDLLVLVAALTRYLDAHPEADKGGPGWRAVPLRLRAAAAYRAWERELESWGLSAPTRDDAGEGLP